MDGITPSRWDSGLGLHGAGGEGLHCVSANVVLTSVAVSMVRIREMRVAVAHRQMAMNVLVRHTQHDRASVLMLMVRIVNVLMRVFQGLMRMLVSMVLRQVQPDTPSHQGRSDQQLNRDRLVEKQHRHQRAKERCNGKVGPCARRTQMPQRQDEQGQAGAVAEKPE